MCYAKPGPRCYGHAKKTFDAKEAKLQIAKNLVDQDPSEKNKVKFETAENEYKKARKEMDETTVGLKYLRKELNQKLQAGELTKRDVMIQYAKASSNYKNKMLAYDKKYQKVDGKAPSPMSNSIDPNYRKLIDEVISADQKRIQIEKDKSLSPEDRKKKMLVADKKYNALKKKKDHAVKTQGRFRDGHLNRMEIRRLERKKQNENK